MDLRRMKTIFIFVLVALNILFIAILYNANKYKEEEQKKIKQNLTVLLSKRMIYLPEKIELPQSPDISNFYLEKMFGDNDDLIEKFLGSTWQEEEEGRYTSQNGILQIENDEFKFFNQSPKTMVEDFSEENIEKVCREEMKRLGILSDLYVFSGVNFVDQGQRAIFTAKSEESVFFDAYISFDVTEKGITTISGRNMVSDLSVSHSGTEFLGIISILPDLSENPRLDTKIPHTIVSITPGYYIGKTAESYRNILAIPVWQIAIDSGEILYYDARNGNIVE